MTARITFFPVGNGDMTLIETESGKTLLIDCNIRSGEEFPDVLKELKGRLKKDEKGRHYVDVLIWSHPDQDHCRGISEHFYLGDPDNCKGTQKIFIRGLWSSPMVFRRANKKNNKLCDDAIALKGEAVRRVDYFKKNRAANEGNYVLILGEDENGKTDNLGDILLKVDQEISSINGQKESSWSARLLGPSPASELEEDEENLGKNHSSVIFNHSVFADDRKVSKWFLSGGDAEVLCWEQLFKRLNETNHLDWLNYDILQCPHHCSWHSLSNESRKEAKEAGKTAKASDDALSALGQANTSADIVSSSDTIKDDDNDPPCYAAKEEYMKILKNRRGNFTCVSDIKKAGANVPLVFEIGGAHGKRIIPAVGIVTQGDKPKSEVNRQGGDGYA